MRCVALCLGFISGHLDDDGLPHGFCTVTYSSTDRFEGNFVHGEKNGRGKFFFFDGRYTLIFLLYSSFCL